MAVKPIPDGYPRVMAYLAIDGAAGAIDFYKKIFGAQERFRMGGPDGKVGHAELELGDSMIMLADEAPEMGARSAKTIGGSPVSLMIYVENVDEKYPKALAAGGKELRGCGEFSARCRCPIRPPRWAYSIVEQCHEHGVGAGVHPRA